VAYSLANIANYSELGGRFFGFKIDRNMQAEVRRNCTLSGQSCTRRKRAASKLSSCLDCLAEILGVKLNLNIFSVLGLTGIFIGLFQIRSRQYSKDTLTEKSAGRAGTEG
jgi:hypothetical protein